ncbi:MAG: HlyD family secretion protein [Candidatus Sulfotelmatobacter sp.]
MNGKEMDGEERTSTAVADSAESRKPGDEPSGRPVRNSAGRRRAFTIFFAVLGVIALGAFLYWLHARKYESTDDAFVEMHLGGVGPRVDGTITKVYVENNQFVHAGDPLIDLDPRDNQVALDQAQALLNQARSQVLAQRPNVPIARVESGTNVSTAEAELANTHAALAAAELDHDSSLARLSEAQANNAKAQADLARYKILIANEEVSQQEYDQVATAAKAQEANVAASRAAADSAGRVVDQRKAQLQEAEDRLRQYRTTATQLIAIREASLRSQEANSESAQAQLEQAQLKLAYTRISAPADGIIMKRSAEVGTRVSAGQQLLTIAQSGDIWVTANFKETQLSGIRSQQPARIHVDALNRDFDGYVETIGGATGAIASVLPPENATGNYVKVVQRIPVRLRFKPSQSGLELLRAGMSVEPEVRIER